MVTNKGVIYQANRVKSTFNMVFKVVADKKEYENMHNLVMFDSSTVSVVEAEDESDSQEPSGTGGKTRKAAKKKVETRKSRV